MIEWSTLVQGGVPLVAGAYLTALAYGALKPASSAKPKSAKWFTHMKWVGPLLMAFGPIAGWQAHVRFTHPPVAEMARQLTESLTLPVMLDEVTRLDSVEGKDDMLIAKHTVLYPLKPEKRQETERQLQKHLLDYACNAEEAKVILSSGYGIKRLYQYQGDATPVSVSVSSKSCAMK